MPTFKDRLMHGWNAFMGRDAPSVNYGTGYSRNNFRHRSSVGNERSIINAIFNRIAVDCSQIRLEHARLNKDGEFQEVINSSLNDCLTIKANKDQTGRQFIQDVIMSMFDEGNIAILPIDTSINPNNNNTFDINSLRCGKITQWYPDHVKVSAYNDRNGQREERVWAKSAIAIVENPFYSIMNEPNSVLKRLIRKLNILDAIDEQSGSGKLDLVIQFPYPLKGDARKLQAEERRSTLEAQLNNSKYGIGYVDSTEKIIQLNRGIENNLLSTIEYLQKMMYSQLGITDEILNGSANEQTMLNYYTRTVEPILSAIADEIIAKFLTKTARSQGQTIYFFRKPFSLAPTSQLANLAEKLIMSEVLSSNEMRALIGYKPKDQPGADELGNPQLYNENEEPTGEETPEGYEQLEENPEEEPLSVDDVDWKAYIQNEIMPKIGKKGV